MPVSADLLKALAEDPKSLEHQLGCMAGLFQIFDRQGLGRRYGSKRVSNAGSGQSQPTSACETPRHDHHHHRNNNNTINNSNNSNSHNNPYWMFEEDASQRISGDSFDRVAPKNDSGREPHHRPAYSDSSEIFTKSFETPTESRTSPDEKSNVDQSPLYSEESSVWDTVRDPVSFPASRYSSFGIPQLNVVVPSRAPTSSDIRDIVRASFERDHHQRPFPCSKEKPRLSVDAGSYGQYLKNLPRSASVDGKDRSAVAEPPLSRHPVADLPRSSSVGGRGASRMLADWKDGLRSSTASPRLTNKERDALSLKQKADATRLTVDLKEGPRLSVSVDDRRTSLDNSPRPIARFRDVPVPAELQPNFNRAADIKEFLRGEKRAGRDEHRFSVDGTRDAPRACIAPRLSVDGRDNDTGTIASRKLKLIDNNNSNYDVNFGRQSSGRKASNVVARLMGLDELVPKDTATTPNKAATWFSKHETELYDQAFLQNPKFSPPPPPSPPDDYDYAHHASDHEAFRHARQTQRITESSTIHDHFTAKHQLELHSLTTHPEGLPTQSYDFKDLATPPSNDQAMKQQEDESKTDELQKDAPQLARKAPQGRRSLWHIFEAMQLKGLLHGSSRRKQAEALRLHNLKEKENQEIKDRRRSQSLPPRLSTGPVAKDLPNGVDHPLRAPDVFPRLLMEVHMPGSAHELVHQHGDEVPGVVEKPLITRSLSCKAPAPSLAPSTQPSANLDGARKYHPAEDTTPKNLARSLSKSVGTYHRAEANELESTLQQAPETSSQSVNGRQSRKERGAGPAPPGATSAPPRMTKFTSDVPQREQQQRDYSPRCPRGSATSTTSSQESRPARSCSPSAVSPRCPSSAESATSRLTEAGKVRRKAVAVKDREESKASLVHLRANATKQEFLKERASGDPDTPRLLRRSSSESKLLSKIVEKPAISTESGPSPKGRSGSPTPNMSLLRSKRPVSKDTSKSPMKTRPTTAVGMKGAAKTKERAVAGENLQVSQGNRLAKPVSEGMILAPQPDESKAQAFQDLSQCGVRATHGGALDQSGDTMNADARDHSVNSEPKVREKTIEVDEGVKTPRGVSIKKIDFSQDAQADVGEQPSPVSVLDNSHFDEELTPSPKAGKTSVVSLQDQTHDAETDRRWSSARFLDLNQDERPASSKPQDSPSLHLHHRHLHHEVCLKSAEEELSYIEELLQACNLETFPDELESSSSSSSSYVIDPITFDNLESQRVESTEVEALDRRILFDCVNEVLERLLASQLQLRWNRAPRPARMGVAEILSELVDIPCLASDDVCDTVYVILQKDLVKGRQGPQWSEFYAEVQEVGGAVERMIVKDLVEDTVRELCALPDSSSSISSSSSSSFLPVLGDSSRRQLFI